MNRFVCIIALMVVCKICNAQPVFQKAIYGMNLLQAITIPTMDGGYALIGRNVTALQDEDIFLIKMDATGDTLWTKTYVKAGMDFGGEDIIQTMDGGYLMAGSTYILKTDSTGQPLWAKYIALNGLASIRACTEASNGDLLIAARAYDSSTPTHRIVLTKLSSTGSLIFMKSFGNFYSPEPYCVIETNDGGYLIAGETAYAYPSSDAVLIKTDSMGNVQWARQYGGNGQDKFCSVAQTANGDYIALGTTSLNTGNFLVKVDTAGALLWARAYTGGGNTSDFGMITKTSDQHFVFVNDNATLAKMDADGTVLWARSYKPGTSSFAHKRFNSVYETADGGLIASGYYLDVSVDAFLYLVKSDSTGPNLCFSNSVTLSQVAVASKDSAIVCTVSTGSINNVTVTPQCLCDSSHFLCIGTGITENEPAGMVTAFPNPFGNQIQITSESNEPLTVILYDITARKLVQHNFVNSTALNTAQLTPGIYIYEVRNKNGVLKKEKLMKN